MNRGENGTMQGDRDQVVASAGRRGVIDDRACVTGLPGRLRAGVCRVCGHECGQGAKHWVERRMCHYCGTNATRPLRLCVVCDRRLEPRERNKCAACRAEYGADAPKPPPSPKGTQECIPPLEKRKRRQLVACYAAKHECGLPLFG